MISHILNWIDKIYYAYFEYQIANGLDKAYENGNLITELPLIQIGNNESSKYIIFSDQHKGARNGADDFQRSERAYNAALAYYLAMGYSLITLGDVEELWEEKPQAVLNAYPHTLALEKAFHEDGRYYRAFGNHDDIWQYPDAVQKYLRPYFGQNPLTVHEGFILPIQLNGMPLGHFFLVHGHQGTLASDHLKGVSKWPVRYLWRPLQRLTKIRLTTPAKDWQMRQKHNFAMYAWAVRQPDLVLITGHTHYPIFLGQELALQEEIEEIAQDSTLTKDEKRKKIAVYEAKLEWIQTIHQSDIQNFSMHRSNKKPCYFNTGCCSFSDGDITGLEIADNMIRLVRWPDDNNVPMPKILAEAELIDIFDQTNPKQPPKMPLINRSTHMVPW